MQPDETRLLDDIDRLLDAGRPAVASLLLDTLTTGAVPPAAVTLRAARADLARDMPAQAVARLQAALAAGPYEGELLLWHARAAHAAGDTATALASAAEAAARLPTNPDAIGLYATLLMDRDDFATAATALDMAIAAGATAPVLHYALAIALLTLGSTAAARAAMARGLATAPDDAALLGLLARHPADAHVAA
jgi:predicted Zn-dependent protease